MCASPRLTWGCQFAKFSPFSLWVSEIKSRSSSFTFTHWAISLDQCSSNLKAPGSHLFGLYLESGPVDNSKNNKELLSSYPVPKPLCIVLFNLPGKCTFVLFCFVFVCLFVCCFRFVCMLKLNVGSQACKAYDLPLSHSSRLKQLFLCRRWESWGPGRLNDSGLKN